MTTIVSPHSNGISEVNLLTTQRVKRQKQLFIIKERDLCITQNTIMMSRHRSMHIFSTTAHADVTRFPAGG